MKKRFSKGWKRVGSTIIDLSIINLFASIVLFIFNPSYLIPTGSFIFDILIMLFCIFIVVFVAVVYQYFMFVRYGKSFGKMIVKQEIRTSKQKKIDKKTLLKREFYKYYLFYFSFSLYGIWNFYKVILKNKNALHEKKFDAYTVDL